MNISRKWLREFVDITATDKEYDSVMTLAGQKVETTERMDAEIKNVVVGKVLSMKSMKLRPYVGLHGRLRHRGAGADRDRCAKRP